MKLLKLNVKVNLFVKQTVNVLEKNMEIKKNSKFRMIS